MVCRDGIAMPIQALLLGWHTLLFFLRGCHIYYGTKGLAPSAQRVERYLFTLDPIEWRII